MVPRSIGFRGKANGLEYKLLYPSRFWFCCCAVAVAIAIAVALGACGLIRQVLVGLLYYNAIWTK